MDFVAPQGQRTYIYPAEQRAASPLLGGDCVPDRQTKLNPYQERRYEQRIEQGKPIVQNGSDSHLHENTYTRSEIVNAPAERFHEVVDFPQYSQRNELTGHNR